MTLYDKAADLRRRMKQLAIDANTNYQRAVVRLACSTPKQLIALGSDAGDDGGESAMQRARQAIDALQQIATEYAAASNELAQVQRSIAESE